MPIEINLISGSLKNLFPSLLFHCTIRMECQKTYKKLKDSVFYFFSLDPLYALSASNEKSFKKWWWSVVVIWWFAKNFNIHLRSLCIYFFIQLQYKMQQKKKENKRRRIQYFVTNLHKITCMLQLFFACLLPTECAYNLHWSGRLRVYVGMVVVDECFRS